MKVKELSRTGSGITGLLPALRERHHIYRFGLEYGRFVYRWRWLILIFWTILAGVSVPFALRLPGQLTVGSYTVNGSQAAVVADTLVARLHQPRTQASIVFQSAHTPVSNPAYQREIQDVVRRLKGFPHTTGITPGSVGKDGRTTFILLNFDATTAVMQQYVGRLRSLLPQNGRGQVAQVYLTGPAAISDETTTQLGADAERADLAVFPLALLVLLLVFGTFNAAVVPLLLAAFVIPVALAVLYALSLYTSLSSFILNIVSVIGLGVIIDYNLLIVRRFREELTRGGSVQEAVGWTLATAGEAILFSSLTVMIGFTGVMLLGISEGIGGTVVVIVAALAALTLLPAILSIIGFGVNSLRLPRLWRLVVAASGARRREGEGFWHRLAMGVMRRPILVILLVCCILAGLGWPVFFLKVGVNTVTLLPESAPSRHALDILQQQFPNIDQNPVELLVQTSDGSNMMTPGNLARLAKFDQWLARQQHITSVNGLLQPPAAAAAAAAALLQQQQQEKLLQQQQQEGLPGNASLPQQQPSLPATTSPPTLSQQQLLSFYSSGQYRQVPALRQLAASTTSGNMTWIELDTNTIVNSDQAVALVNHLRNDASKDNPGLTVLVGGTQAGHLDFNNYLYSRFPRAVIFTLIITYILLLFMFRSVLIPLKAVVMNILSISAAYGTEVFVFQWGHFSNLLGFTSMGFVDSLIPILLFGTLFGLSMDYEVFLLSRIREEWLRTGDNIKAVALGLEKTGGVITNAALLFVIVTVAFTFTSSIITKEVGVGLTVAILVDATIIRSLFVPATMRLLGRWNWWWPVRAFSFERPTVVEGSIAVVGAGNQNQAFYQIAEMGTCQEQRQENGHAALAAEELPQAISSAPADDDALEEALLPVTLSYESFFTKQAPLKPKRKNLDPSLLQGLPLQQRLCTRLVFAMINGERSIEEIKGRLHIPPNAVDENNAIDETVNRLRELQVIE
jgi:RND superfamily putative drug exporter